MAAAKTPPRRTFHPTLPWLEVDHRLDQAGYPYSRVLTGPAGHPIETNDPARLRLLAVYLAAEADVLEAAIAEHREMAGTLFDQEPVA